MKPKLLLICIIARILRVFFYLLYHHMAWSYDFISKVVSGGRWKAWVITVTNHLHGLRILELGHGPGYLQRVLMGRRYQVFGIDSSTQMNRQARKRIIKEGYDPSLVNAYAQKIPFPNDHFNHIVVTFPTPYISEYDTLLEAYRTLKPGGSMVVLPVAWITGKNIIDKSLSSLFRITGQSQDWDPQWLMPFKNVGFLTESEMIHHDSWKLVIITAQKPVS